jgi:hypothetical protein
VRGRGPTGLSLPHVQFDREPLQPRRRSDRVLDLDERPSENPIMSKPGAPRVLSRKTDVTSL